MNTQIGVNRILAVVALILAVLSLFVSGPLLTAAVICLALAVVI